MEYFQRRIKILAILFILFLFKCKHFRNVFCQVLDHVKDNKLVFCLLVLSSCLKLTGFLLLENVICICWRKQEKCTLSKRKEQYGSLMWLPILGLTLFCNPTVQKLIGRPSFCKNHYLSGDRLTVVLPKALVSEAGLLSRRQRLKERMVPQRWHVLHFSCSECNPNNWKRWAQSEPFTQSPLDLGNRKTASWGVM